MRGGGENTWRHEVWRLAPMVDCLPGMDATVKIWDALSKEIHTRRGHTGCVRSVAFSPDGEWIASASLDGKSRIDLARLRLKPTSACKETAPVRP
jgi:WD40 repeat protein